MVGKKHFAKIYFKGLVKDTNKKSMKNSFSLSFPSFIPNWHHFHEEF